MPLSLTTDQLRFEKHCQVEESHIYPGRFHWLEMEMIMFRFCTVVLVHVLPMLLILKY